MVDWKKLFDYDSKTGTITRRDYSFVVKLPSGITAVARRKGGISKTHIRSGYAYFNIFNRAIYAHRIIWEMHYGKIPDGLQIDHIDRNKMNNLLENLRAVSHSDNVKNASKRVDNTSGYKGVSKIGNRWRSQIQVNGKKVHLGLYLTKDEAYSAYVNGARKYYGEMSPV